MTRHNALVWGYGFSALKEMDLETFAEFFTSSLPLTCLVYDNRGFGDSDAKEGQPIVPKIERMAVLAATAEAAYMRYASTR